MGRQPIFIARNRDGELNAYINACSHRGAMLCRFRRGSRVIFTCPFHGWTFTNSGQPRPVALLRQVAVAFLFIGIETRGRTIEELYAALAPPTPVKIAAQ
jgi:hypothetical protein